MGKYKALATAVNMLDEERRKVKELEDQVAILRRQVRQADERERDLLNERARLMTKIHNLEESAKKED